MSNYSWWILAILGVVFIILLFSIGMSYRRHRTGRHEYRRQATWPATPTSMSSHQRTRPPGQQPLMRAQRPTTSTRRPDDDTGIMSPVHPAHPANPVHMATTPSWEDTGTGRNDSPAPSSPLPDPAPSSGSSYPAPDPTPYTPPSSSSNYSSPDTTGGSSSAGHSSPPSDPPSSGGW